jgi:dienelactone hydrolase
MFCKTYVSRAAVHHQWTTWPLIERHIGCATHAGGRAETPYAFKNALLKAWREGANKGSEGKAAYVLDTVWDLVTLLDFLELRPDVDPVHIGATGIGMGALQCAMLVAVDCRVAAAAPMMGLTNVRANIADRCDQSWL